MNKKYHHGNLREALLEAAEIELKQNGLAKFSLRGVAKRAEVSHAAPAHHFGDVNGLLSSLAAISFERFGIAMQEASEAKKDPKDKLVAIGMAYISYATNNPHMFELQFSNRGIDLSEVIVGEVSAKSYKILEDHVSAVLALSDKTLEDAPEAPPAFWAMAHGLAVLFGQRENGTPLKGDELKNAFECILSKNVGAI